MKVDFAGFKDSLRVYSAFTYWNTPSSPGVTYFLNYEVTDNLGEVAKQTTQITASGVYAPLPPAPTEYILTITPPLGGTTDPTPAQYKYAEGSLASIRAIPQENYIFDHWNLDGANVGTTNPISFNMNTNHTLEALFTYLPPGPPPVAPPAPAPEEVITVPPPEAITPPAVEVIPSAPLPSAITPPPPPQMPSAPIAPETAGLIVLGAVALVVIVGATIWYFTKPPS